MEDLQQELQQYKDNASNTAENNAKVQAQVDKERGLRRVASAEKADKIGTLEQALRDAQQTADRQKVTLTVPWLSCFCTDKLLHLPIRFLCKALDRPCRVPTVLCMTECLQLCF